MASIRTALTGYAGYRGREGQWSFILHRLTGLGTLLFLLIHIVDTSFVYFFPSAYADVIDLYRTTFFGIAETGLVFSVIFHGVNGLRVAYYDLFAPRGWTVPTQRSAVRTTLIITLVLWIPATVYMLRNLLMHNYGLFGG